MQCSAKYIIEADSDYDLKIIANLYTTDPPSDVTSSDQDGITLILCHATGFSKETWEPFLRYFFERVNGDKKLKVKAVYSIENSNHEESAMKCPCIPREHQEHQMDKSTGRYPASASYVEGVRHLVLQQNPAVTADAIYEVLLKAGQQCAARRSRL